MNDTISVSSITSSRHSTGSNLVEVVENAPPEKLSKLLRQKLTDSKFPKIFSNILTSFKNQEASQIKKRKVIATLLHDLNEANLTTQQNNGIINQIISDLPNCSLTQLVKLVEFCNNCIRDDEQHQIRSWKDLLPAILSVLEQEKFISHANILVSGPEYKSQIVKSICDIKWNVDALPCLAQMFVEMILEKNDRAKAFTSLCNALNELSLNQVPPFTYHTLKLCKQQNSRFLLDALKNYFEASYRVANVTDSPDTLEELGTFSKNEVQDTESTVLYHIHQTISLNHETLKDYLKYIKTISSVPEYILQRFVLNVLLSVSEIYEDQVLELLRAITITNFQEEDKCRKSAWLRKTTHSHISVMHALNHVIENSTKIRHLVLKGLIDFAFLLMSTEHKAKGYSTLLWKTGANVLKILLTKRHETVGTILQMLIEKIMQGGPSSIYHTDCLAYACRKLALNVLENQVWITSLLECLLFLSGPLVTQVLHAILPLMHISRTIRDNLILTLRKALYRKGALKREMAVTGFLEMLKNSKIHSVNPVTPSQRGSAHSSTSSSILTQVTVERCNQMDRLPAEYNKTACYEILHILKKCFTYECEVRAHLYEGFYDVTLKHPQITETILDTLLSHLNCYLETDENILPPLKLDICTSTQGPHVIIDEPIGQLIFFIQKIYVGCESKDLTILDKTLGILESLCKRMTMTNLEHFNLDDNTDIFEDVIKSQKRLSNLKLAISVYEALIAFRVGRWCESGDNEELNTINDLVIGHKRGIKFMKQCAKPKKEGKKKKDKDANNTVMKKSEKPNMLKPLDTIMDLDTIRKSLSLLYSMPAKVIEDNEDCHHYWLQACHELLQRVKSPEEKQLRKLKDPNLRTYIAIAGLLYKMPISNLPNLLESDEQSAISSLECFKDICDIICSNFDHELPLFLKEISSETLSATKEVNTQLQEVIFSFKPSLKLTLCQGDEGPGETLIEKVPLMILEIIEQLASKIDFDKLQPDKVFGLVMKMAQATNVRPAVAPVILQLLLRIEESKRECGETLLEVATEVSAIFGTIDEIAVETSVRFKILDEGTGNRAYILLCHFLKEKLENASWFLQRIKSEENLICASPEAKDSHQEKLRDKERSLCKQLCDIMQVLHTLTNTAIDPGPCTDIAIKNLLTLYNLLANLTKYFISKSSHVNAPFKSVKFIDVVQLAGKPLKSVFYNFVTHIEDNQNKSRSKSDAATLRNKVLKETKLIPRVVYAIEQFCNDVLTLSKKTGVHLGHYLKHSVTRDFRIKNPELVEGLEKMDVSTLITQNTQSQAATRRSASESSDNDETSSKRSKTSSE